MIEVMYAWLEDVKTALDVPETVRANAQIVREIQGASRGIEGSVLRYFYPSVSTQTFDWPDHQYAAPWRLWLDGRELTSVTQVLAAGQDITSSVLLRPDDAPLRGQPFTKLEIDLSSNASFNAGATFQRSISVTGTFGYCAGEQPGGTLAAAFTDTTGTTGTVSDSSLVGVGAIVRVDTERMAITGKALASTGVTLTPNLTAANNNTTFLVSNGSLLGYESITIDGESMLIQTIAGNTVTVLRAWDGTTLAAHTGGATIYAPRQVTVERGVLGTTAATHATNAPVNVHVVPPLIRELCIAETLSTLTQSRRGFTQILKRAGSGKGGGPGDALEVSTALDDLRTRVCERYGRLRIRTAVRLV